MEDKSSINFVKMTNKIVQISTISLALKLADPNIFQHLTVPAVKTNFSKVLKQHAFTFLGNETLLVVLFMVSLLYDS